MEVLMDVVAGPEIRDSKKKKTKTLVSSTNLDLEAYANNYQDYTRIERLLFIADHCPPLQVDSLKLALDALKRTLNYAKYTMVLSKLNEVLASKQSPAVAADSQWIESAQRTAKTQTEKLENDLKVYKNNLIKESIRMGNNDLGRHYLKCGDLSNALKSFSRARDFCVNAKQVVEMCLNVIEVSIAMGNFAHVQSYVLKAEGTSDVPEKGVVLSKLKCATGLEQLDGGRFKRAAKSFVEVAFELGNGYNEVISANDIATYGGLCALASFDRAELKAKVIDNAEFKQFLELEPQIREIIYSFYQSKYTVCLEALERIKGDLLLDMYLHNHVENLYQSIRKKALVQYFSPFLSVDMNRMAQSFNTSVPQLESEIAALVMDGQIQARIDSHNKVLVAKRADQRSTIFETSFAMANEYEKLVSEMLMRVRLQKSDFVVKG
ncbi:26S proteasome subunit RPN7-domain-containing protein [Hyaloraphidium curvatum]|nr:26S proteasome subunit RPN7-domain-containing protein [Hyaloraphidium curvatum]